MKSKLTTMVLIVLILLGLSSSPLLALTLHINNATNPYKTVKVKVRTAFNAFYEATLDNSHKSIQIDPDKSYDYVFEIDFQPPDSIWVSDTNFPSAIKNTTYTFKTCSGTPMNGCNNGVSSDWTID